MSSILEIRRMGSILERKGRGRIWGRDISGSEPKKKRKKLKQRKMKHANEDFWKVWENE